MSETNERIKIKFVVEVYNKNSCLDVTFIHNGHITGILSLVEIKLSIKVGGWLRRRYIFDIWHEM
jgi:hypothetical protein